MAGFIFASKILNQGYSITHQIVDSYLSVKFRTSIIISSMISWYFFLNLTDRTFCYVLLYNHMNEFKANASFQVLPLLIQLQDVVMVITSWFCVSSISIPRNYLWINLFPKNLIIQRTFSWYDVIPFKC